MSEDSDTVELPPLKRPSHCVDVAIGVVILVAILFVCAVSTCGYHHV
jgi:hypothetical protein